MADLKEIVNIFDVRDLRVAPAATRSKLRGPKSKLFDNNEAFDLSSVKARWWPVQQNEKDDLVRVR